MRISSSLCKEMITDLLFDRYFDLVDPEDSIKIDFEKIEHDMLFAQKSFISAFFKDKREELENV